MALVTDDALTLAAGDYSETSQIVTLFSHHNGRLSLLAKGSKRARNAFGGPIDKLQVVQAVFSVSSRGGLGQLVELSQQDALPGLTQNLPAFYAASYIAELVLMSTEELDPHPEVFKMLLETLRRLSQGPDSAILVYRFEVRLLTALGLMPQLAACVACRRKRGDAKDGFFSPAAGGLLCRQCRELGGDGINVGGKALDALAFLAAADDESARRVRLSPETAAEMRKLLRVYWPFVLGRQPRALKWVT